MLEVSIYYTHLCGKTNKMLLRIKINEDLAEKQLNTIHGFRLTKTVVKNMRLSKLGFVSYFWNNEKNRGAEVAKPKTGM